MKELIKRLRYIAKYNPSTFNAEAENQAASAIELLAAENERLKKAIQEWVDGKCISQKHLLMIGKLQRDIPHSCEYCKYTRADGGCRLLPDGDRFSPDYTEGFDRDDCEKWEWRE